MNMLPMGKLKYKAGGQKSVKLACDTTITS